MIRKFEEMSSFMNEGGIDLHASTYKLPQGSLYKIKILSVPFNTFIVSNYNNDTIQSSSTKPPVNTASH